MDGFQSIRKSLQFKLSLWLTAGVLLLVAGACCLSFFRVFHEATELLDEELQQVAMLLVRHDIPIPQDTAMDREALHSRTAIVVQKLVPGGAPSLLPFPDNLANGFHTLRIDGNKWRLFITATPDEERFVVAQRFFLRNKIALESALATLVPLFLFMALAVAGACLVVRHVFRPVRRLAAALDERKEQEPGALGGTDIPSELIPFMDALNRMLERVARSVEMQRRFVADAAHELRSPLTALSLQAERLEAAEMSPSARERLGRLRRGLNRARSLLNQMLTLARVQSPLREEAEDVSLAQAFRQAVEELILQAEAGKIDLGVTSREDIVVRVPPHAVEAVLKNLVDNAIRYTPEGGRVDLHAGYEQGVPVMIVSDTGPGIPEEELGRVFDPFYRCMGNAVSGSGLGLSIVRTLVESWGGSVSLENLHDGGKTGLRARVRFPAWTGRE